MTTNATQNAPDTNANDQGTGGQPAELSPEQLASQGADPGNNPPQDPGTDAGGAAQPPVDPALSGDDPTQVEPKPADVNKRFSEVTKQRDRAEREAREANDRLNKALEALGRVSSAAPAATAPTPPVKVDDPEPQPPEFQDPEQYQQDMAEYTRKVTERSVRQQLQAAEAERERKAIEQSQRDQAMEQGRVWQERRAKAIEEQPDFVEVTENPDLKISPTMAIAITRHENGPQIAYYLGQHPEVAARIAKLPDALQLMELGELKAQIAAAAKPRTSKAPPPPAPARGTGQPQSKSLDEMDMDEYVAARKSGTR